MSQATSSSSGQCLPIQFTVGVTYRILWAHFIVVLQLFWLPFVICAAAACSLWLYMDPRENEKLGFLFTTGILYVAWIPTVPAMTAWIRFVIFDDIKPTDRLKYRVGKPELSYASCASLLFLAFSCVAIVTFLFSALVFVILSIGYSGTKQFLTVVAFSIGYLCGFSPIAGYLLILPAAAVQSTQTAIETRIATSGNVFRLFANITLANFPVLGLFTYWLLAFPFDPTLLSNARDFGFPVLLTFLWFSYFIVMNTVLSVSFKLLCMSPSASEEGTANQIFSPLR